MEIEEKYIDEVEDQFLRMDVSRDRSVHREVTKQAIIWANIFLNTWQILLRQIYR